MVTDGFQNFWDNFLDTFGKTEEAALNVLVVIPQYLIKLIEKLNLLLYRSHPPKIQFDQKQERKYTLASYNNMLMFKQSHQ